MTSSNIEAPINISSETISSSERCPDSETSDADRIALKNINDKVIVISDTDLEAEEPELEEGEIDDEGDIEDDQAVKNGAVVISDNKQEIQYQNSKRKLSGENDKEVSKKCKEDQLSQGDSQEKKPAENEFLWSELNVLMVGDERVVSLNWEEWENLPSQELFHLPNCDLSSLCAYIEKHLHKEYDVVFILAFHYDFVSYQCDKDAKVSDQSKSLMCLKENVNVSELARTVQKYHYKWVRQYPNTNVIWTIPSPPDFFKFNSVVLSDGGINPSKSLDRKVQYEMSKKYFSLCRDLAKEWREGLKYIPVFPLNKVLFMKKHCYKKTFTEAGSPKFPRGFVKDGFYPTKMMAVYCAYLLVEFIIAEGFYPENSVGLDFYEAEEKLLQMDPTIERFLYSSDRQSSSHSRQHSHRHLHKHKKRISASPQRSRHRSRSRKSRSWSSSRHHHRTKRNRKSDRKPMPHVKSSSSRSSSREGQKHDTRHKQRDHLPSSRMSLNSTYSSEAKNQEALTAFRKKMEMCESMKAGTKVKDEVAFWKTLRYLRQVHDIQCDKFRHKPRTHPQHDAEKRKFFSASHRRQEDVDLLKWNDFWQKRMEQIFEETWTVKKQQLTQDLTKKGSFSSFNAISQDLQGNSTAEDSKKGSSASTINQYLKDFQFTIQSLESSRDERAQSLNAEVAKDFTLADIFKETPKKELLIEQSKQTATEILLDQCKTEQRAPLFPILSPQPTPPPVSSESSDESSIDSDVDLDGLMKNPDFLQGLDEIDKELQNAAPSEDNAEPSPAPSFTPEPVSDLASIFTSGDPVKPKVFHEELQTEFVNVLKMLFRVSKRLGPLGLSVSALYLRASEELRNKREKFTSLNSDSKSLLTLVEKRLILLLNDPLPLVQKAIYGEISERLQALLSKIDVDQDKFSKVNVYSIAVATLGQEVASVVSFIKNTLLYHGYTQFTSDDVMNIYMSVKASQLDMEKS